MKTFQSLQQTLHRQVRLINLSLITALMLSLLPLAPQPAQAAAPQVSVAASTETACTVSGIGKRVFLPLVSKGGQANAAEAPVAVAATERTLRYQPGKTYTYRYDVAVQSQSNSKDAQGIQSSDGMALGVIADVAVAITGKEGSGIFHGSLTFHNTQLCNADISGNGTLIEDDVLLKALVQPLLFTQESSGVISEVSHEVGVPDLAVNLQKGALNSLQLTMKGDEDTYSIEEVGGQGTYTASYALSDSPTGLTLKRTFTQDSFLNLIQSGDENKGMILQNQSTIFLDAAQGVLTSVNVSEKIVSADETDNPVNTDGQFDGATTTSGTQTRSTLTLSSVIDTPAQAAAAPQAAYVTGGLGAVVESTQPFRPGLDLDSIDLTAEFVALEAAPDNPTIVQRIADLIDADDGQSVLTTLQQRLTESSANDERVMSYIDVLGVNGSPQAQLAYRPIITAPFSLAVQEHALIGLLTVRKPTTDTLQLVNRIANDNTSPLRQLGLLVLGGLVPHFPADPTGASPVSLIKQQLIDGLQNAADDDTRILYLDALGNAGDPAALSLIAGYLATTQPTDVREAAIYALRKLAGEGAEGHLLTILNSSDEEPVLRELVANVLRSRKLSPTAVAALAAYETASEMVAAALDQSNGITFKKTWNKHLGGKKLGINLPGSVTGTEETQPERKVSLVARQEAVAHAWSFEYSIALAELVSKRVGDKQQFRVHFSLLNNKIKKTFEKELQCAYSRSGNLYKATHVLIDYSAKIPVWAIVTVNLGIRATGSISLDYTYNHDLCDPLYPLVSGSITPSANATLEGYAALSVVVLRGGASVSGSLLNTSIPAKLTVKRDQSFELCIDITVKTKPLVIAIKIFAERRKLNGKWKRFAEKTLYKYETPQKNYPLLQQCVK